MQLTLRVSFSKGARLPRETIYFFEFQHIGKYVALRVCERSN